MPKFLVSVVWQEAGRFIIEAADLESAIQAVEDDDDNTFGTQKAHGEYIDDSFEVNHDCCEEVSEEEIRKLYSADTFVSILDVPKTVELDNGGAVELEEDGTIRYLDSDGNCELMWERGEVDYQQTRDLYFPE